MFISTQSKLVIFFAVISIIVSSLKRINFQSILGQIIIYYLIARNADCLIYGKCYGSSWISISLPILGIVLYVLDYMGYFKNLKKRLDYINLYISKLNDLNKKQVIIEEHGQTTRV